MNKEEFIAALKVAVHDSTIKGMKSVLDSPPGRKPHKKTKEISLWFNSLPEEDKQQVDEIIKQTVHASIFGILSVLDGVRAIESTPEKGNLELIFNKDGKKAYLNDPQGEMLHDIYQVRVQAEVFED
jgi:hypothetical protein